MRFSLRASAVIGGVLGRAGEKGKQRRLQDAAKGNVSWTTSPEIVKHMKKEVNAAILKRKEVMGRMQSNIEGFTEEELALLNSQNQGADAEVSEDDMVNMMGQAQGEMSSETSTTAGAASIALIEAHLSRVGETVANVEAALEASKRA